MATALSDVTNAARERRLGWEPEEERRLAELVDRYNGRNFETIARELGTGRTGSAVSQQW